VASNNDLPRASTHLNPALDWCPSACLSHLFLELMRYAASVGVGRAVGGLVHLFHVAWKVAWPGCTEISKSVHHKRHVRPDHDNSVVLQGSRTRPTHRYRPRHAVCSNSPHLCYECKPNAG